MNSKLELRLEAAKIAAELEGVTLDNFHEAVSRIEHYILGCAELPEQDGAMPELMDMLKSARQRMEQAFDRSETGMGIGSCTGIGDADVLELLRHSNEGLRARYAPKGGSSVF